MKVALICDEDFDDYNLLCESLEQYKSKITLIIGVNELSEIYADDNNIKKLTLDIDKDIINSCDCVISFWDGIFEDTNNLLNLCIKYNKPYKVFYYKDKNIDYDY